MKQVNVLTQKVGSWCLAQDADGNVLTGYDGYNAVNGSKADQKRQIETAQDFILRNPTRPTPPTGARPRYEDDRAAYDAYVQAENAVRSWDHFNNRTGVRLFETAHPVFEDVLVFDGYSKGQSSFTLDFIASNGQKISFGPQSTGKLVAGIIAGEFVKIVDTVNHLGAGEYRKDPTSPTNDWIRDEKGQAEKFATFFTGKAIALHFYFHKQGQNIYAQLYTGKE